MDKKILVIMLCSILVTMSLSFPVLAGTPKQETVIMNPPITITIETPQEGNLYVMGAQIIPLPFDLTIVFGPLTVRAGVTGINGFEVAFFIDNQLKFNDTSWPFEYPWWDLSFGRHTIKVELVGYGLTDSVEVFKIF